MNEQEWLNKILELDPKAKFIRLNDPIIETHQQEGKLQVKMVYSRGDNRGKYYYCKCDCGNYTTTWGNHFRSNHTKSCGCYMIESGKNNINILNQKMINEGKKYKDISNQTHGWLLALEPTKDKKDRMILWNCKCLLCGKICKKTVIDFRRTVSCGCIDKSQGVKKIEELLTLNNIYFEEEKRFESCRDRLPLPFDFYVNNQYLIEFDGEQHYKDITMWGGIDKYENRIKHDNIKNEWCKNNNIPLIRIPYNKVENLCLNDLLLETSSFII